MMIHFVMSVTKWEFTEGSYAFDEQEERVRDLMSTNNTEKYLKDNGIMHFGTKNENGTWSTLCKDLSGLGVVTPYVSTQIAHHVNCETCLKWLHA